MSTTPERPPANEAPDALTGGLASSDRPAATTTGAAESEARTSTLGSLPVGARLVVRCRKDWRAATVAGFELKEEEASLRVVLNVASPTGHTYRLRRPPDSLLSYDGAIPLLGGDGHRRDGLWRAGLARYDVRW